MPPEPRQIDRNDAGEITMKVLTYMNACALMREAVFEHGFTEHRQPLREVIVSKEDSARAVAQSQTVEYRDIPGFPGYRVGSDGSVWSCKTNGGKLSSTWKRMSVWFDKDGYPHIGLRVKGKKCRCSVSSLVLASFVGPPPEGCEACHTSDPSPSNCSLGNLRWDTHKNNIGDKRLHGTHQAGEKHPRHKLSDSQVAEIRKRYVRAPHSGRRRPGESWETLTEIAESMGITLSRAWGAIRGWRHL